MQADTESLNRLSGHATAPVASPDAESRKRQERRLRLLRQSGHLGNDRSGAAYCRAMTSGELESAYRLVHDVYVEMGYILRRQNGLRMRAFELCPETATFVAKTPSCGIIGSISVIVDSPDLGLPSDKVFKEEIDAFRREGRRVCEMSNQAVLKEFRRLGPGGELMRCAWAYAVSEERTDVICAVTPQLVSLYETICFEQVGPVKSYSEDTGDETVLMRMADIHLRPQDPRYETDEIYRRLIDYYYTDNPHFRGVPKWNLLNQRLFSDEFAVAGLFGKCPDVLGDMRVSDSLHRRLGHIFELSQLAVERDAERKCRKVKWQGDSASMRQEKQIHTYFGIHADLVPSMKSSAVRNSRSPAVRPSVVPSMRTIRRWASTS